MRTTQSHLWGRTVFPTFATAVALWCIPAAQAENPSTASGGKDSAFIREAAQDGQAEVRLGNLAAERGQNAQTKELGQALARDHSKANQELMPIAAKCGVTLPTELSSKDQSEAHDLQGKNGADFDKAFLAQVIKDHESDIDKYQKALKETKDADVKVFIEKSLPVLRQHLQMARSAGSAVGLDRSILATADRYFADELAQTNGTVERNHVTRLKPEVGTAPGSQTGAAVGGEVAPIPEDRGIPGTVPRDLKHPAFTDLPVAVQNTIKAEGDPQNVRRVKLSTQKGQTVYIVKTQRDGRPVTLHIAEDGSLQKSGNWFSRLLGR